MVMYTQQFKPAAKSAGQGKKASMQAPAEQIIQQYKNSFMRRENSAGKPLMQGGNLPAVQLKKVIQLFPDYNARPEFNMTITQQDTIDGMVDAKKKLFALRKCEENIVRPALTGAGVHYRYGGSFAAFFQGAQRLPGDVDVEVEQPGDVATAGNAINATGTTTQINAFGQGVYACLTKDVLFGYGRDHALGGGFVMDHMPVSVDISNEASPQFSQNVKSPAERGHAFASGDTVSNLELIMNYLDRMAMKGNSKNDHLQIADLIISAGMVNNPNLKPILHQHIDTHIKNMPAQYKMLIDRIIDDASAAHYNKSPQPRPA